MSRFYNGKEKYVENLQTVFHTHRSQLVCLSPTSMSSPKKSYLLRRPVQLQELAFYCAMAKVYLVTVIVVPFV